MVGVVLVTIFSDPMVDALTSIASKKNNSFRTTSGKHGQHIPIPGKIVVAYNNWQK